MRLIRYLGRFAVLWLPAVVAWYRLIQPHDGAWWIGLACVWAACVMASDRLWRY